MCDFKSKPHRYITTGDRTTPSQRKNFNLYPASRLSRGEDVGFRWALRRRTRWRRGERAVMLQYGQHSAREEVHILFAVVMWDATERELRHEMIGPGHPLQFDDLLNAVVRRADDLDLDIELGCPHPLLRALQAGIGLGHLAVGLVAFDGGEMSVREMVVVIDRLPFLAEPGHRPVLRLLAAFGAGDVGEDDRRRRVVADGKSDLAVIDDAL